MVIYPNCPKCENSGLSIIDIEINGRKLKGVQCNFCNEIVWVYQDNLKEINDLKEIFDSLESRVEDLED